MLPQSDLVKKYLSTRYDGLCNILESLPYPKVNSSTGHREVMVREGIPCHLSLSTVAASSADGLVAKKIQVGKLILAPDVEIRPGSKIVVIQQGKTTEYQHSGEAGVYATHQEIMLELFAGYT